MTTMSGYFSMRLSFLLLLLLAYVFASSFTLVIGFAACRRDQIQTLIQLKNEFDSRGCNHNDYFNGVHCDNVTGAITKLQLPSGCLSGILKPNSSLFGFHHLRYLNLSHNNFTSSSLPCQFGNLKRLEVLSLSSSGFLSQVPSSLSNLSLLTYLDLSDNKFSGGFPFVRNITKLSFLDLSFNHFLGTIPSTLLTMPFLSYLDLQENHLNGSIEVLNSSSSSRLESLSLRCNLFEGKILEPISKLINLKHLDMSFLNTSYPIDLKLLSSFKHLVYLDLSGNSIAPTNLSSHPSLPLDLEVLGLSNCDIGAFPNFIKDLQNLEQLKISNNKIEGKVPEWLWDLPRLKLVDLSNNSFVRFEGCAEVLVNSSVQMLFLDLNNFKGAFPIPPLSIKILSARVNSFTGNIPLSICNRSFLDGLDLSYNEFTGPIPRCLSNIRTVNLRENNLEGSIADEFYSGALIQTLDVGYNRLTGKLPMSLLNCSYLEFLSIDNNRIEDAFPFWLKALPNLQVFTLRSNKFYGPISPPDQGPLGFPELRIFELSDNNFTGSLPQNYFLNWKGTSLKRKEDESIYMGYSKMAYMDSYYQVVDILDLHYKGLNMEQQMVLTSYATIDFSGNKLEGEIPESIGLLKPLIALNLSNNAFIGQIPSSLANLTELESLDLSRNQLSGTIPKDLGALSFLSCINVSHNQLKGGIPQATQIIGQPKSSFEGNARLCGFPLKESCFETSTLPIQRKNQEEEEEEVLNWKIVAIGYKLGVLFGLAISQVVVISYKPGWLPR